MISELAQESFKFDNTLCWFEIVFKVKYFESVNNMYGVNRRTGAIYLIPSARELKDYLHEQMAYVDPITHCPWITENSLYKADYTFILRSQYLKRDTDNMIKLCQDGIFECLHVNDSHIVELRGKKLLRSGDFEYLIFKLTKSELDYNAFNK